MPRAGVRLALVAWLACLLASELGLRTGLRTGPGTGFNTPLQVIQSCSGIKVIENEGPHKFVMLRRMVFGVVVGDVGFAGSPEDAELFLINSIADPVESHVYCLRSLLFDCAIHDAGCGRVVSGNGGRWLWVAHFGQCGAEDSAILGVMEKGSNFSFSGGGHDTA